MLMATRILTLNARSKKDNYMYSYLSVAFYPPQTTNTESPMDPGGDSLRLPRKLENILLTLSQLHDDIDVFIKRFDFSDARLGLGF